MVFYDYDEICLLTECNFRTMPEPRNEDDVMAAEPWFYVGPHDIFPSEFRSFMGLYGPLLDVFLAAHGDLLGPEFWREMQALHTAGEVMDIFPYRPERRLRERLEYRERRSAPGTARGRAGPISASAKSRTAQPKILRSVTKPV